MAANRGQKEAAAAANEDCLWRRRERQEDQKRGEDRERERETTQTKREGDGRWSEGVRARDIDGDDKRKK